jgi:hypothetical protein
LRPSSALRRRSRRDRPLSCSPNSTLERTVSQGKSADSWNMTMRSGPGPWTTRPSTRTSPSSGSSRPAMMLSSVVLPHPDGPHRATNSPRRMLSHTSRSASTWPVLEAKTLLTPASSSLGRLGGESGAPALGGSDCFTSASRTDAFSGPARTSVRPARRVALLVGEVLSERSTRAARSARGATGCVAPCAAGAVGAVGAVVRGRARPERRGRRKPRLRAAAGERLEVGIALERVEHGVAAEPARTLAGSAAMAWPSRRLASAARPHWA